jgi:lysozyme
MKMSEQGLALIKRWEGFRASAYRDAVGVWTIGYGHTSMAGAPHVERGMSITRGEADTILRRDVAMFAEGVTKSLQVTLSDNQFSALVSFAYNVGLGNWRKSSVLAAVNRRDFAAVPRRLQLWNKAGGQVLPGLINRRAAEAALFAETVSDAAPAFPDIPKGKPPLASKTVWSALAIALATAAQAALAKTLTALMWALLLVLAAAVTIILVERWKKMKEEAL